MGAPRKGSRRPRPTPSAAQAPSLRATLVEAALAELEQAGRAEAVTIAAILQRAQCTPPSLYHYWPSREHLLREAASLGWSRFRAAQATAEDAPGPRERILIRGEEYLRFSHEQPGLFRLLFLNPPALAPDGTAGGNEPGPAFAALVADVTAAIEAGEVDPRGLEASDVAMTLWCAIHGLATLTQADPTGHLGPRDLTDRLAVAILGPGSGRAG